MIQVFMLKKNRIGEPIMFKFLGQKKLTYPHSTEKGVVRNVMKVFVKR